eukprot:879605-Amphidinium_carterae.1
MRTIWAPQTKTFLADVQDVQKLWGACQDMQEEDRRPPFEVPQVASTHAPILALSHVRGFGRSLRSLAHSPDFGIMGCSCVCWTSHAVVDIALMTHWDPPPQGNG